MINDNFSKSPLSTVNKLLTPAIDHNTMINRMTNKEKLDYIKKKYNLVHGKGKRKKHKKK